MKALVTGAGALLGQGVIRSLQWSSLKAEIVAADPNPLSVGLYWAGQARLIPPANDPGYWTAARKLLEQERPDVVLIGTDVELSIWAERREEVYRDFGARVIVSSPEVVAIADDKWLTYLFLKRNNFPYPDSSLADGAADLVYRVGFPLIVKPRVGARSIGVHKVHDQATLDRLLATASDVIVQECVASDELEFTAGAVVIDGDCKAVIVMRRDLRDGNTYRAYVDRYPELEAYVAKFAEALKADGPVNFQFRLAGDKPKVFEINGRFSGTTPLRARVGFNEVEMVIRNVLYGEPVVQPEIKPAVILRYWSEDVIEPSAVSEITR